MAEDRGTRNERVARALFRAGPGSAVDDDHFEKIWKETNQHYWRHEAYKWLAAFDAANPSSQP